MNTEILYHSKDELMKKFDSMVMDRQNKVLRRALEISLNYGVGTCEYAIIRAMGYIFQEDGSYAFVGKN